MTARISRFVLIPLSLLLLTCSADGRGFGGFRGGAGGYRAGGFSGYRSTGFSANRSAGWGGYHTDDFSRYRSSDAGWSARGGTFDRSWDGSRGGSISSTGYRGAATTPWGGAAGRAREVTATGPEGRSFSSTRSSAAAWNHFPTDGGLSRYSSVAVASTHRTAYWSHNYLTTRAGSIRTGFGYYGAFRGGWYGAHPGCWRPAVWVAGVTAWSPVVWATFWPWCGFSATPAYYDYGNTIVYQGNNVYIDGTDAGTAEQYATQAINLATQGQQVDPPATDPWQSLGVYALVPGDEKTSNNIFQLAVNQAGTIRGNYYDGLMDTTTPVYGSVDKKTQRAAWSIGKKTDRVFEAGVYDLTLDQTPVLVHFGKDRTQQWLLVRMQQPPQH